MPHFYSNGQKLHPNGRYIELRLNVFIDTLTNQLFSRGRTIPLEKCQVKALSKLLFYDGGPVGLKTPHFSLQVYVYILSMTFLEP